MSERVTDLEVRVAYQDQLIEDLSEVVREFAARVERLERQVKSLSEAGTDTRIGPALDKPPHY